MLRAQRGGAEETDREVTGEQSPALEGVVRRDLSIRVKERIQQVGFALLAALMIVVIYNDVITNVLLLRKG